MASYTVSRGDTLSGIAKKYGINWRDLYNANKSLIGSNPNYLRVGTTLSLSGQQAPAQAAIDPLQQRAANTLAGVNITPFNYKFEDLFKEDLSAARESSRNEAINKYAFERKNTLGDLLQNYANRGLYRSGARTRDYNETDRQYTGMENALQQQLYNSRLGELEDRFKDIRSRWEQANREGKPVKISDLL